MKKILGIAAVILFFVVLLGLVVVKLLFPSKSPTSVSQQPTRNPFQSALVAAGQINTDSPSDAARTCFQWYVQAVAYGANAPKSASRQEAAQCFTGEFISKWDDLIESTGSDPVLLSQDFGTSWNTINVSSISESVSDSNQLLAIGTGDQQIRVAAHLVKDRTSGSWRIDSVSKP